MSEVYGEMQNTYQKKRQLKYNIDTGIPFGYLFFVYNKKYRVIDYYQTPEELTDNNVRKYVRVGATVAVKILESVNIQKLYISKIGRDYTKDNAPTIISSYNCFESTDENDQQIIDSLYLDQYKARLKMTLESEQYNYNSQGTPFMYNNEFILFTAETNDENNIYSAYRALEKDKDLQEITLVNNNKKYKFSRDDFYAFYKDRADNKRVSDVYYEILCKWIDKNLTLDDIENKGAIHYGYVNDEIRAELLKVMDTK